MDLNKKINTLKSLTKSLNMFETQTNSMVSILDTFDEKLLRLEKAVMPIYKESGNLQTRLKNSELLLQNLDHILSYFNTYKESEPLINQMNISEKIDDYLNVMDKIVSAKDFFTQNHLSTQNLQLIRQLYEKGLVNLEKEFKNIVATYTRPIQPHVLKDIINHEDELTTENIQEITSFNETVSKDLNKLAKWLTANSDNPQFMSTYSSIRSENLLHSLKCLRDHIKSQSGSGSSLSTPSSFLSSSLKLSNTTSHFGGNTSLTAGNEQQFSFRSFKRKFLRNQNHSAKSLFSGGGSSGQSGYNPDKDVDVDLFLQSFNGLISLMMIEEKLIGLTLPETLFAHVFGTLVQAAFENLLAEGDFIVGIIVAAIKCRDFYPGAISIFPIYRYVTACIKPRVTDTSLLMFCKPVTRQKFESLCDHMCKVCFELLEEYLEMIRNTSGPASSGNNNLGFGASYESEGTSFLGGGKLSGYSPYTTLPKDGIVHEITSNTCLFVDAISDLMDLIGTILIKIDKVTYPSNDQDASSLPGTNIPSLSRKGSSSNYSGSGVTNNAFTKRHFKGTPSIGSSEDAGSLLAMSNATGAQRRAFSVYVSRLLSTLGLNLRLKFEAYNDEALGSVFLINNFAYILGFLQKNLQLLQIVRISTPKVEEYYEQQIQEFKRVYSQSWGKALYYMSDKSGPSIALPKSNLASNVNLSPNDPNAAKINASSFKLKDRDKQAIKDKFAGFNKEFEEISTKHKRYFIPDAKIREILRMETKSYIVPIYREFRNKYKNIPFSKSPEKYIKYETDQISEAIDKFFSGTD